MNNALFPVYIFISVSAIRIFMITFCTTGSCHSCICIYIYIYIYIYIIQIYSGITCGRVLNGELYTCKLYKLINLCWSTGCFVKLHFAPRDQHRLINLYNLHVYIYIYTCKLYKLINLCWSTGCFVKLHFTPRDIR